MKTRLAGRQKINVSALKGAALHEEADTGVLPTGRVVAQFRSGHRPIPVLFECYRIRTDSGMPRLGIRFSTSHLMMPSTR